MTAEQRKQFSILAPMIREMAKGRTIGDYLYLAEVVESSFIDSAHEMALEILHDQLTVNTRQNEKLCKTTTSSNSKKAQ